MTEQKAPAGPKGGLFGLGNLFEFQKDTLGFLSKTAHDYGDIIHFRFGPYPMYIIKHPDYIHELLITQNKKLEKWQRQIHVWEKSLGHSSLTTEGEFWRKQRKLLQPAFHSQRIKHYTQIVVDHVQRMFERWGDGTTYEISEELSNVTMGIIAEILFSMKDIHKDAAELNDAILGVMEKTTVETNAMMPLPDWVPSPRNLKENHALKVFEDYIMKIIKTRRAEGEDRGDLLSSMLLTVDEEEGGIRMDDRQVCDEAKGLFAAGHETTAMLLTWTLYALAQYPDVTEKLYQELSTVLQGRAPTWDDLEALDYTEKVLRETLRLYPPAWSLQAREALEDIELGDVTIQKGGVILMSPWVMHHDERFFDDPQRFNPERFEGDYKKRFPTYAYFPFGGGQHVCIGSHLAMMEAKALLAMLTQQYTFELVAHHKVELLALVTVRPKHGVMMKVTKR